MNTLHLAAWLYMFLFPANNPTWGFHPHKIINRHAIYTLPPAMIGFYKHHMNFITEEAVAADHRRYAVAEEGARHYIDLDYYGIAVSRQWNEVLAGFPNDSIQQHGILPWHLMIMKVRLTEAFKTRDYHKILRLSSDSGHYLADAHVPLHTTSNYNGQFTGQQGIHGFWETRIPELLIDTFDLWIGKARYQQHWYKSLWKVLIESHQAVDSVLLFEQQLTNSYSQDRKYAYEVRLSGLIKVYSQEFSKRYHQLLNRQVERRFRAAISAVGDFWYTCWVDAGQPNLGIAIDDSLYIADYQMHADSVWRQQHQPRK